MVNKKVVCFGEVLWDALPKGIYLGGSPLNVALNLDNLGIKSTIASAVGNDRLGELALKSIKQKGLSIDLIQVNEHPTGLAEVEIDREGIPSFEIHENTAWDFISVSDKLKEVVSDSDFLVFGSLIFRSSSSRTIRKLLKNYKGKCVIDVNFRKPFYNEEIVNEVLDYADILKLNIEELNVISKWKDNERNEEDSLKWLSEEFDIETVLLSRGEKGAYIYSNGDLKKKGRYYVKVRDTVGAGDAFLAGAIYSLIKGESTHDIVCFANAIGAFVASRNGATPILDFNKIDIYLKYGK